MQISYTYYSTDLGLLLLGSTERNEICFLEFGDTKASLLRLLKQTFPQGTYREASGHLQKKYKPLINGLVTGKGVSADVPVWYSGTAFQEAVWEQLRRIPVGETRSYREIAKAVGKPKAVRAVAQACAANRVGMLVACHRVVRSDGGISGYRWGVEKKLELLARESKNS